MECLSLNNNKVRKEVNVKEVKTRSMHHAYYHTIEQRRLDHDRLERMESQETFNQSQSMSGSMWLATQHTASKKNKKKHYLISGEHST